MSTASDFRSSFRYHPHVTLAQELQTDELDELIGVARARWEEFSRARASASKTLFSFRIRAAMNGRTWARASWGVRTPGWWESSRIC